MAETYNFISVISFSLSGIGLIASICIWFKFGIWGIIGDLSGRTAKKSIEQMRAENEKSGKKSYRPSPIAVARGGITEVTGDSANDEITEKLDLDENLTELLGEETEVLTEERELFEQTTVLDEQETDELMTELLSEEVESFRMIQDIILVHTNETI